MTKDEIIIELTRDLYSVRKELKEEKVNSTRYAGWWSTAQAKIERFELKPKDPE